MMNFIFDIGNVIIYYKPDIFLKNLFGDKITEDTLLKTIFLSPEWLQLDQGIITPGEARGIFCEREPDFKQEIYLTMERIPEMLTPVHETVELLPEIKSAGHPLYYLSNYHKNLSEYILDKYDFFKLFDGGVFSCDVHILKPSLQIYRCLLEKYSLSAKDCLFFDDMKENVEAGQKEGINSVLFTGADCVKPFIMKFET